MYTLRRMLVKNQVQSNVTIGESYTFVDRDAAPEEFVKVFEKFFSKPHGRKWVTKIHAICPQTREMKTYEGPNIEAPTLSLAHEYCQNNGLGYCDIEGVADIDSSDFEVKTVFGFVIYDNGSKIQPLYKDQRAYIMTESGDTFSNLTYRP